MRLDALDYEYPESAVAIEPLAEFKTLLVENGDFSIVLRDVIPNLFEPGDCLVINNTQVIKRRIYATTGEEVLFVSSNPEKTKWRVLFQAKSARIGDRIEFPESAEGCLEEKGLPQLLTFSHPLDDSYFARNGELALPPYIQAARGARRNIQDDERWYQTAWSKVPGSLAAPTASLHFSNEDLDKIRGRGVHVSEVTLHVGTGTFLPIRAETIEDHRMHREWLNVPEREFEIWQERRQKGGKIWALGTTAVRAIESCAQGILENRFSGTSDLFIYPGYDFKLTDRILTNFHQPRSTLLALVAAFAGLETVKSAYQFAIANNFRLFSYGDLSIWKR